MSAGQSACADHGAVVGIRPRLAEHKRKANGRSADGRKDCRGVRGSLDKDRKSESVRNVPAASKRECPVVAVAEAVGARTALPDGRRACSGDKFVVEGAGEEYDARESEQNRRSLFRLSSCRSVSLSWTPSLSGHHNISLRAGRTT